MTAQGPRRSGHGGRACSRTCRREAARRSSADPKPAGHRHRRARVGADLQACGVELVKGAMSSCADPLITSREECLAQGGEWLPSELGTVDNIFSALQQFF